MAELLLPLQEKGVRQRLLLLTGQAFFFGVTLAMLIVSASAIFLSTFGAGRLPYVYITVALLGALVSYGLTALQQRWSLPGLAINTTSVLALLLLAAWLALRLTHAHWVSFVLLVIFSLYLQIGFVFIGGLAGRLFDVRQIKRLFPRVVSGFAIGFMLGGLLAAPLLALSSKTEDLLLSGIGSALLTLLLLLITSRRFAAELAQPTGRQRPPPPAPLLRLLRKPFVLLIFIYQMLSAIGTQLIDFMVYERAAARYTDSADLAQFVGNFTALLNLVDILFLALVAGFLVSRFGLSFGLTANAAGAGLLVGGMLLAGLWLGPTSTLFFVFVGAARIADITLTDGATRTALNAAYQVLPPSERLAVQTGVEGIGVPLALGLTGVILLIFQAIPALTILHLVVLTLGVTLIWTLAGFWVYRGYAHSLLDVLRTRTLEETDLSLTDSSSLAVVERLVASPHAHEVRLGLDLLQQAEHPALPQQVLSLLTNPVSATNPEIQGEALQRIEQLRLKAALPAVEKILTTTAEAAIAGAALRAVAALTEGDAIRILAPYLDATNAEIRTAALVGLLRYGGIPGVLAAGERLLALEKAPEPAARQRAAQVIGDVGVQQFYQPLLRLLQDPDRSVRQAAILAAAQVRHPDLLPLLLVNLAVAATRPATITALTAYGETMLPVVEQALTGQITLSQDDLLCLVQCCGQMQGEKPTLLLRQVIDHPDHSVGYAILVALQTVGYRASAEDLQRLMAGLQRDATHGLRLLLAQQALGPAPAFTQLQQALDDELHLVRRRLFRRLVLRYDAQAILRAEHQLHAAPESAQALAVEMLDVTLTSEEKPWVLPLLNPHLSRTQQLQHLAKQVTLPTLTRDQWLCELILDPDGVWGQPWLRVCAIYSVGQLALASCGDAIATLRNSQDGILRETVMWALAHLPPPATRAGSEDDTSAVGRSSSGSSTAAPVAQP